ncbi:MAG TPA: SDR family oxidoreductase [Candidatus Binatia bacterium]|jgi:citronellol/citronellal dehydrogenase|nr:SDR family oxidoreductase [Candidatus Binatia bacterium]
MPFDSIFRPDLFAGETHVVTGGGSGIGRCTAHELGRLGATVVLVGRKAERLVAVKAELADAGVTAHALPCDIRDEEQVRAMVTGVLERTGRIDGLVNNAGGQFAAPLAGISQKGWETVVRTNLTGGFLCARECYTQWMNAHGGAVVNIVADMWGSMPGMGHSGAARMGMVSFTETAAVEWAASGVRVNAVAPGWIASSGFDTYPDWMQGFLRLLHLAVPLQRLGTESEVSAAICFLLSPAAAFISGSTLRVDGAAPNAKLTSPLSALLPDALTAASEGRQPWPLTTHDRSRAWNGFHLAVPPKATA